MSQEEAHKKMGEIKKKISGQLERHEKDRKQPERPEHRGSERARHHLMNVRRELGEAVKAGKISREEAGRKFAAAEKAVRERMAAAPGRRHDRDGEKEAPRKLERVDWDNLKRRIEGAVSRGDMTRKEADAKYREIKERVGQTPGRR